MTARTATVLVPLLLAATGWYRAHAQGPEFTRTFALKACTFSSSGRTPYFVLESGHTSVLEDGKGVQLTITVLDRTENVGGVVTRVVEERQIEKGQLVGEAVDNYKNGKIVNHDGAWRHGTGGATAGLIMPALPLLGARYYQEVAPGVAMDRAEVTAVNSRLRTPYGALDNVLITRESTPMEPGVFEVKAYAPGIGIIRDAELLLVSVKLGAPRK